jgi:hypothetical protein
MFLCSRWGKTESELNEMPAGEFRRHFIFWQRFKWGIETDLQAAQTSQLISYRTGKRPPDNWAVKDYALHTGHQQITQIAPTGLIRKSFDKFRSMWGNVKSKQGKK